MLLDYALLAWVQQVRREARYINTDVINLERLYDSLNEIRLMTSTRPEYFEKRLVSFACWVVA